MSGQGRTEHRAEPQVVRRILIQVEGRDKPVINTFDDTGTVGRQIPTKVEGRDKPVINPFVRQIPTQVEGRDKPVVNPFVRQIPTQVEGRDKPVINPFNRQIPVQVEGRDKPVINTFVDTSTHYADYKPYQANMDRADYFANDAPTGIHHPSNMKKSFDTSTHYADYKPYQANMDRADYFANDAPTGIHHPSNMKKSFDTSTHYADYKPYQANMDRADYFANDAPTGIHHPSNMKKSFGAFHKHGRQPPQQFSQQNMYPQRAARGGLHRTQSPPPPQNPISPKPQATPVDPITQILAIRTDVYNLRTDIHKFTGNKKDKTYNYIEEMLISNLVKLVLIECDNDHLRTIRKKSKKFILHSIELLEFKAEWSEGSRPSGDEEGAEHGNAAS